MSVQLTATTAPLWYGACAGGAPFPDYPFFTDRATTLGNAVTNHGQLVLVAGCGTGWTVKHLADAGFTAVWGCDASQWAIDQAKNFVPALSTKFVLGDALSSTSMRSVATTMGVNKNGKMALCITDDLLTVAASDAEVTTMLTVLRSVATTLIHILWVLNPWDSNNGDPGMRWHTLSEWQALIGTTEPIIRAQDGVRLQ